MIAEFPDVKGFSYTNIKNIRQWFLFWQQLVGELEIRKSNNLWAKVVLKNTKQLVSRDEEKSQQLVGKILI